MSLKPPKHSEQKWPNKRSERKRSISLDYNLIVTEGTQTEPQYFDALKANINRKQRNRIQLEIRGLGDNTVNLFYAAKKMVEKSPNGYSHVWLVYDCDDFPSESFNMVQTLCDQENEKGETEYHAIWSNECIELWFLLHFCFMHSNIHRSEYYPKLSEFLGTKGEYKKNRSDIFEILLPHLDDAIKNALKLESLNEGKTPYESAPGTKVHEMMEKFKPYISK